MEAKLDKALKAIQKLTTRIDCLEAELDKFELKYETLNEKFNEQAERITDLKHQIDDKADQEDYDKLLKKIDKLEKEALMRESYSKRLNLLIHGLKEKESTENETKLETCEIFNDFLLNGLQVDPTKIQLVDIHRLPQHPVSRSGKRVTQSIIIKLANAMDKQTIMANLKHLKPYNEALKRFDHEARTNYKTETMKPKKVFVAEHLPQKFYEQKMNLMSKFKEAREAADRTRWGVSNGSYCLFKNDNKVDPSSR